jgi:multimeric flavodoxin WrbA
MKVVAIGGSPRLDGNTNYLLDRVLDGLASRGIATEKIILSELRVNPCQGHDNCSAFPECLQKDDAGWILDKFSQADGIVLASPVYFRNISAQMKAFVDRSNFFYKHNIKIKASCVGLITVAAWEGTDEVMETLSKFVKFSDRNARVFSVSGYADKPGAIKSQSEIVQRAREMGRQMAEVLNANQS